MLRVGLIGLGFMGKVHLGAYAKLAGVEVGAVSDADPKRAKGDLSTGGADNIAADQITQLDMTRIKGTTDPKELMGFDDIDIIDICVPTPFHTDLAIAALATGKHVLCEKPLARTSAEAKRIADAANKAKGFFMPAMCMRFWPHWAWLKQAVDQKRYGRVLGAVFRRAAQMPGGWFGKGEWSGGALLDLHIHDTDFVHFLFGEPQSVSSRGYSKTSGEIDHIVTQYAYADGPSAVHAEGAWCLADGYGFTMRYTVNFENATADFDIGRDPQLVVHAKGKSEPITVPDGDGYEAELAYFVDCINKGQRPTVVTAQDAVTSIAITEAEGRSIATGQPVKL